MDEQEKMQTEADMMDTQETDTAGVCMNCGSRSCDGACSDSMSEPAAMPKQGACVCGTEGCHCKKTPKKMILKVIALIIIIYLITLIV